MSVRLFHRHTRLIVRGWSNERTFTWYALHRRPIEWAQVLAPALALVGFVPTTRTDGISFAGEGSIDWTRSKMWTTIRLRLPRCSDRKAALLEAGLMKAARYGEARGKESAVWHA